jgi:uncharacterized protein with LGFP repeats
MGAQKCYLKASTGPIHVVGDNIGTYVLYQGGAIYYASAVGAWDMPTAARNPYLTVGGPRGVLGYPVRGWVTGLVGGGWLQQFQHGAITDSASTTTQIVTGGSYTVWTSTNFGAGVLGYPTGPQANVTGGWMQHFQKGVTCGSSATKPQAVWAAAWTVWQANGRETGPMGFPTSGRFVTRSSGFFQRFQRGGIAASSATPAVAVFGEMYAAWLRAGQQDGVLGYPRSAQEATDRGARQVFETGELWQLGTGTAWRVYGAVLTAWTNAGGATGSYGYPTTDTTPTADGHLTCTFEGGTITA